MVRLHKFLKVSLFLLVQGFFLDGGKWSWISIWIWAIRPDSLRLPPLRFFLQKESQQNPIRLPKFFLWLLAVVVAWVYGFFREIIPFSLHSNFISRIYGISNFRNGQTFFSVDSLRNRTTIGTVDSLIQRLREHSHHCDLIRISVSWLKTILFTIYQIS